jgi:hypothetical protein
MYGHCCVCILVVNDEDEATGDDRILFSEMQINEDAEQSTQQANKANVSSRSIVLNKKVHVNEQRDPSTLRRIVIDDEKSVKVHSIMD